jgi:peptidoglycan/LPS O-acetylase OafA/YrhL
MAIDPEFFGDPAEPRGRCFQLGLPIMSEHFFGADDRMQLTAGRRSSLVDGWRGLSVSLVIIGHLVAFHNPISSPRPLHELGLSLDLIVALAVRVLAPIGGLGVQVFFVISGFLITKLLLKEEETHNCISIRAFYVRRICRILPAFMLYMLAMFALRAGGLIQIENEAFVRSGVFLCNVSEFKCSWWLAHTWSLSVEEQFYLAWPILFIFLRNTRVPALLALLIFFVIASVYDSQLGGFAHITIGALTAASSKMQSVFGRFVSARLITISVSALLLMPLWPASFVQTGNLMHAITPFLIAVTFFGTISRVGPLVPVIENKMLQKVGLVSYSLYLWQQLGTAPEIWNGMVTGADTLYTHYPVTYLFILPAIVSFMLMERPLISVGKVVSDNMIAADSKTRLSVVAKTET